MTLWTYQTPKHWKKGVTGAATYCNAEVWQAPSRPNSSQLFITYVSFCPRQNIFHMRNWIHKHPAAAQPSQQLQTFLVRYKWQAERLVIMLQHPLPQTMFVPSPILTKGVVRPAIDRVWSVHQHIGAALDAPTCDLWPVQCSSLLLYHVVLVLNICNYKLS